MKLNLEAIKALREATGAPLGDCRTALEDAGGDPAKATALLAKTGARKADARQDRATGQGRIGSYVHHDGRIAALVEVNCETDFVARSEMFQQFCRDLHRHVAAMNPQYLRKEEAGRATPEELRTLCLLEQPFVRDAGVTVIDLLNALAAKTGEHVVVRRFVRFAVGAMGEQPSA